MMFCMFWSQVGPSGSTNLCPSSCLSVGNTRLFPPDPASYTSNGIIAKVALRLVTNRVEVPRRLFYLPLNKVLRLFLSYSQPKGSEM